MSTRVFAAGEQIMKHLFVAMLIAAPGLAGAQGLLDFRNDLAFDTITVESVAERTYRSRLRALSADGRLDVNVPLLARLRGLVAGLRVAAQFERPDAAAIVWEIHTCQRCDENASAMAGGRLLVGEEFIAGLALTDDELGYVLAHEMAHVLAEHTREFATTARFFVGNGRNRDYEDIQNELDESIGINLRMAPVYAQQEFEADYIGFVLGARSGFDPEAMPRMLLKLNTVNTSAFALHPDAGARMQRVRAMLQTAQLIRQLSFLAR
jgi:Zn-dependent protease with chaperone function